MKNCLYCEGISIKKHMLRKNKQSEKVVYRCKECRKIFTPDRLFYRMRISKDIIMKVLQLYDDGFSYGKIEKILEKEGKKVNKSTIFRWVRRYSKNEKLS